MPQPDLRDPAVPAPRHALAWAALVYAVFTLLLAYPALAGQFLVSGISDQFIAGYPFREFAAEWLRAGKGFPLWNPYQFGGMPYVAAMHGDIFYPTFLLRMVLPTDVAMTWGFIIHLYLAGLFTYLFLRAVGLGFFPAVVGGVAYMLSGQIASYAAPGHDGKLFVSALLPLFLLALHRGIRDGRRWAWGLAALLVGLAVLSPHPQLLQYFLLMGGAYALHAAFGGGNAVHASGPLDRPVALRRLALALGAVVLGLLIGAIQFLPVFRYVDWSPRAGGAGWEHAISYSFPPEELINTYLPQFSGIIERYTGRNAIHFHSEYLGAVVLLLALAAFGRAGGVRRSFLWFWVGTFVVTLLWALGGYTPFFHLIYALVPGTKFFRAPSTIYFVATFAVAMLAAVGTRRVLARAVAVRYAAGWALFALLVLALAFAGGLTNVARAFAFPGRESFVTENQPALVLGAARALLFVLLAGAVLVAHGMRRLGSAAAGWALVALAGLDLWSVERHYWRFSPPASELYASDPTIDYLKSQQEPGRVLPLALGAPQTEQRDPYLLGVRSYGLSNAGGLMVHGIRNVLGYHGNELGRYQELLGSDAASSAEELFSQLANPNIWQLLNVRFFLTDAAESPFRGATRLLGPVRDAAGTTVYLYRLPGDNPAAWVTPVIVKAPDPNVLATLREPAFDVRSAALFDTSAAVQGVQVTAPPTPIDLAVTIPRYEPGAIDVRLAEPAPEGAALVVSENYYPGWQATVDGRPAPTARADYSLIGVALPAGAREVQLRFHSEPYERGKLITLLALGASLLLIGWGAFAERARRD
ncbi:MAG TPA: YfhO family protein [Gemmatimonadaceae bacterium]|nr:YfhO family protein [Gemmatimonadaceae bacterium]